MNNRKYNFEIKVGLFIFLALILLIIIVFSIAGGYVFQSGYNINLYFNYVGGLEVGSPVRLAGVKIGEVKDISILHKVGETNIDKTIVKVKIWVKDSAYIRSDSIVEINTLGLLGEKYLEILPGIKGEVLKQDDVLIGKDPILISEVASAGYGVLEELRKTIIGLNNIMEDHEIILSIKEVAKNSKYLTENLIGITHSLEEILDEVKKGEGTFGKLFLDDSLYKKIEEMVDDIRRRPWRLLHRPTGRDNNIDGNQGYIFRRDD